MASSDTIRSPSGSMSIPSGKRSVASTRNLFVEISYSITRPPAISSVIKRDFPRSRRPSGRFNPGTMTLISPPRSSLITWPASFRSSWVAYKNPSGDKHKLSIPGRFSAATRYCHPDPATTFPVPATAFAVLVAITVYNKIEKIGRGRLVLPPWIFIFTRQSPEKKTGDPWSPENYLYRLAHLRMRPLLRRNQLVQGIDIGLGRCDNDVGVSSVTVDNAPASFQPHGHFTLRIRPARDVVD